MTTDTFSSPEPVAVIPADRVRPLIAATERELAILERTATEALAAANDAEEWERAATNDGADSTWALVRLYREQRDEAQRDAQVMIELATRHAEYVLTEAQAEVDALLAGGPRVAPSVPVRDVAPPTPPDGPPRSPAAIAPAAVPVAPVAPVVEPPSAPPTAQLPAVEVPTVTVPTVAAPTVAVPTIAEPIVVAPAPPVQAAPIAVPTAAPIAPTPAPTTADGGFWPAEPRARRRWALPFSAALEATAVLLILVFILLRLA